MTRRSIGWRAALGWTGLYGAVYLLASGLDLWTTELALRRPGSSEANVYATVDGVYAPGRAWVITAVGAAFMLPLFAFGARHADSVADRWLSRPRSSFVRPYLNPFSRRFIDRSPLHAIAWTISFVLLRVLAAGNNLLIAAGGVGPLGYAVRAMGRATTPALGFVLVIGAVYVLLALALAPAAARMVARMRRS